MVIGGILMRSAYAPEFSAKITHLINASRFRESVHWKRVSGKKLDLYKRILDVTSIEIQERRIDFGCIIFDQRKVNHKKHNDGDPEKGFFKFLYQHHLKWHRHYKPNGRFRCFHGNMSTKYDLVEMLRCLNNSVKSAPPTIYRPYLQFDFMPVNETRCLQVSDLLIGAVGFVANGGTVKHLGTPRHQIAEHVRQSFCLNDLAADTAWPDRGCHIWNFQL